VACVTKQGIPVTVKGVVIYKVGDDFVSIANAALRFLDQQDHMDEKAHQLFAGHLRSIVGSLTIEDMIHNREALTAQVRQSSADAGRRRARRHNRPRAGTGEGDRTARGGRRHQGQGGGAGRGRGDEGKG